ncbi:Atrnl1, partial [Symbiodinium microadriaticum]
ARLERLRLPLLLDGQQEALELNLTLKVKAIADGPASSILDTLDGHFDLVLDRVHGLVLKQTSEHQLPLLNTSLNSTYVNDIFAAIERAWPQPFNVRTAAANRTDGEVPEAFRQKQSIVPAELDMQKTLTQAHLGVSLSFFGEVDASSGEDLLNVSAGVVLRATLDLGSAFWRAVTTRREKDFGFVHASRSGTWGTVEPGKLPTHPVLLDIGCGQLRICDASQGAEPYKNLMRSVDVYDLLDDSADDIGPCMFIESLAGPKNYFCAEEESIEFVREALALQLGRFRAIGSAMADAKAQDNKSFAVQRVSGYAAVAPSEPVEIFADTTWFRQFNPIDMKSWFPDLPTVHAEEAETPLQRWARATECVTVKDDRQACRAQEELDSIRYPPEMYGNASIRMVMPEALSVRNSDTTFSFELGGIKFKAPDSAVPGITKADSLEGPLKATLKMKGEFKLSEGPFGLSCGIRSQLNLGSPHYPAFPMSRWFQHPCSKSASRFILFALQIAVLASANDWTSLSPQGTPAARSGHTMVWDPDEGDGGFWMFGGEVFLSIKSNRLYFYNAASNLWTQKASGPAARYRHSAVLDPMARTMYVFAGTTAASAGNTFNDLHLYDVQLDSWTELTGTAGRSMHTAVWDSTSDRMIVFGGLDNMLNKLDSLAEYDRATDSWSSPAAVGPVARDGHVAVWDPATGSMLMCCGASSAATLGDLWSYNGAWSQLAPSGSITARSYASAVWDPQAGALLGFAGSGGSKLNSLFLYSASANSWSEYTETGPPAQDRGAVAWDPVNGRLYTFGGYYDQWPFLLDSLWRLDASHTSMASTSSATSATETATTTTTTLTTSTVSSTETSSTSSITSSSTASSTSSITATASTTSTTETTSRTTTTSVSSSTSTTQSRWAELRLLGVLFLIAVCFAFLCLLGRTLTRT